ncbi:dihydrolipoamide acetyltransferase family protein [Parageobacillus thermoglucosidasius]|uniref:Dihydrolipoamide acetyltransferase component of pyruvate dehydrogenase complex n=4 Tax=Anoxybacillaceae TaxID=3120669 RepID=A0AAN0YQT0_PARTM|nr:dihydrolipoamide acetyltransferase family protein [Parageobacillus thermoglucosidasius]AEH47575.1 Dihydrolipoyllysine-residue acetyltransferase [Parageobacillus thermoglucosidasius C56-YS93]ALF11188.1 dihydrolipoyllysine acetyltransferase [Parageobacillus thermoglucosidasius]ANZ31264.1 dihydrolipoyllysine acetyltransferase [Parageobacillus thermoglucosidasius]APM82002.1 dihydrolipoyllysine acetyltransferase [Parageobacillus thermoglucosidasius]KJX68168.1 dihydrolipoyllysine acetyltransferas
MEVKLHDIGEGMTEAVVLSYFVKKGDYVKADQPLVEVQTDKMVAEIPAPAAGIIQDILVPEGKTISVGTTILTLKATSPPLAEMRSNPPEVPTESTPPFVMKEEKAAFAKRAVERRVLASPHTRKIAREHGVDLEQVVGTGRGGRITDEDVYRFIETNNAKQANHLSVAGGDTEVPSFAKADDHAPAFSVIPFRGRRKQIAKKMAQSLYTIPHCTHFEEVDVTELIWFREELKQHNFHISATAFFIKALSLALKKFPIFNARLDEECEEIHLKQEHHIGIAVDTEEGLIVPVIKHVESKSLREIHEEAKRLTKKAQENKLELQEMTGSTFTISNVGPLGGSIGATPIINYPEVALMAFHKTKKRPVVMENDEIAVRSMMNISMSFDHRIADGATAVAFTNYFVRLIENPKLMLMELV